MDGNNLYLLFPRQKKSKYQCIMFQTPNRTETDQELHEPEPHMNWTGPILQTETGPNRTETTLAEMFYEGYFLWTCKL